MLTVTSVVIASSLFFCACKEKEPCVIQVGTLKITESMLNDKLSATTASFQKYAATPQGRKKFIDMIARQYTVIEAAKKAGVQKQDEFKKALEQFKNEQQKQLTEYEEELTINIYLKTISDKTFKVSDSEIRNYYNKNISKFENPNGYTIRHILVLNKAAAESAYERLKSGEKFEKVAKEVSKDRSAQKGGLIGPVREGYFLPQIEQTALKLKNNELSGIIETRYGYHIILKVSEQKLPAVSLDEAKEEITRILETDKLDAWVNEQKGILGVKVNYDSSVPQQDTEN
jgi:parvulin-like peptidyl-prolyl isomerase